MELRDPSEHQGRLQPSMKKRKNLQFKGHLFDKFFAGGYQDDLPILICPI
jgi:hypothetical protein